MSAIGHRDEGFANLPDILTSRASVQQIHDDVMAIVVRPANLTGLQAGMKRCSTWLSRVSPSSYSFHS